MDKKKLLADPTSEKYGVNDAISFLNRLAALSSNMLYICGCDEPCPLSGLARRPLCLPFFQLNGSLRKIDYAVRIKPVTCR